MGLGISHAGRRLISYVFYISLLFVVSIIIPLVGPMLFWAGGLYLTVAAAAFDGVDCVLARKGWAYSDKKSFIRKNRWRTYSAGAAVAAAMAIPGLNLLALPIGATAATRAFVDAQN
jgi:uncharacterized protein involved in cysteine biosynthesis